MDSAKQDGTFIAVMKKNNKYIKSWYMAKIDNFISIYQIRRKKIIDNNSADDRSIKENTNLKNY